MILQPDNHSFGTSGPPLGVYLHVPFCSTSCDFCGFYQIQSDRKGILSYIEGIKSEVALVDIGSRGIDTMFWGGGTPGLLPAADMLKVASSITDAYGMPREEWSVEMAPSSVKRDKLAALKDAGVTRISMGIQSLNERSLDALGRQHSKKQILKAYDLIRSFDFKSVNVDLIFAIPGQEVDDWRADVRETLALEPDHLSTYCLTFEEDTALFIKLQQGKVTIDTDREALFYHATWEETEAAGFEQYETSNYAKPGHACIHNLNTWRMGEWLGLGPSAASQFGSTRHQNTPDLKAWLDGISEGNRGAIDRVALSNELLFEDSLIFGLRMNEGVHLGALEKRFGIGIQDTLVATIEKLVAEEKATLAGERLKLTRSGHLVADAIGSELLGVGEQ